MTDSARKPRIALMGEFSSGKSTLSNLLLGARPLPEKVTATRLSPVWMAKGTQPGYRIDVDGTEELVDVNHLENIDVDATRVIRLFFEADILEVCDLIDFPGISDPNMSSEVWQRMLNEVDAILWCTHATQAWRQSEAAVWETVPEAVKARSTLLVTKFDKLHTERDQYRVLARLQKETDRQFDAVFPISLTKALAAGDDHDAFVHSGGFAFIEHLIGQIDVLTAAIGDGAGTLFEVGQEDAAPTANAMPATETPEAGMSLAQEEALPLDSAQPLGQNVDTSAAQSVEMTQQVAPAEPAFAAAPAEPASQVTDKSKPVIQVDSHVPVEVVESAMPVENSPAKQGAKQGVVPRRVRPKAVGLSQRPRRPVAGSQTAFDSGSAATSQRPVPSENTGRLRSIFKEEKAADYPAE